MDIATILGMIIALGLVIFTILSGDGASTFLNVPSIAIVFGGTVGVVLICFPLKTVLGTISIVKNAFLATEIDRKQIIKTLEDLAKTARKEGLLALEGAKDAIDDEFYQNGLQLVVDGQEADTVEAILTNEIDYIQARHQVGADVMGAAGTYAPAFGMIGTVIGLIQMLQSMEDPSSIGPAMAVALITTFYGALLSNVVFLPLKMKLEQRSTIEVEVKTLLLEGLLSIHAGDNPRILVQKLSAFVSPDQREKEAA
jgi:chemotaxis protein MotA